MTTENLVVSDVEGEEDTKWLQRGVTLTVILTALAGLLIVFLVNPSASGSTLNFLLINDIHLDLNYENSSSPKDFCRSLNSMQNFSKPFGQYGCDTPLSTFQSMLDYAKGFSEEISFIVLGGNIIPHNITLSREENDDIQNFVKNEITSRFPDKQIYMVLGNTDFTNDYGSFAEDDVDFKALSAIYSPFLPNSQKESFKNGGYYYVDFEDYNARILFLNSVIYSKERPLNESLVPDPYGQFAFIEKSATEAKALDYGVGIVMHLPPSSGTLKNGSELDGFHEVYADKFYEVTKANGIEFIISCHTHFDSFLPTYKKDLNRIYSISSPSLSPNKGSNPSFRMFHLRNRILEDYQQYYADLIFGVDGNKLNWGEEYRFTTSYSVEDLSSQNIQKTVNFIQNTGAGRWMYRERVMVRADESSPYYYCLVNSFDANETQQCIENLGAPYDSNLVIPNYYSDEI